MFAQEQGDWRRTNDLCRPGRQPRPRDRTGQAEHVEHRRLISFDARGKDVALPRARGHLDAVKLRDHFTQAVDAEQARLRLDVLPGEEETHEIGRAHRRNLGAETVQRVAMDAGEETTVTPFERAGPR